MRLAALLAALALPLALPLAACNENTAVGNDREAQLEPAPTPAPVTGVEAALRNVATGLVKPETMTDADLTALGGRQGRCAVRLTEVAFPSFLYEPGGSGAIKLNGKLVVLPNAGPNEFADGGLTVALRPLHEDGDAGLRAMEMIVVPPGAKDEVGYHGYVECFGTEGEMS